ncbi:PDR/VanB family oxidoreductase [Flavisphingomonas formosensis]|uniref:PDR/VanB family oxidoreductase n=1 Tax=Flavisphingomonas formosensis TaxID=861534 RepID=UPI0012F82220|nr:PDR/VanB family oxidoreductase [Sphingomonas formosensis]
MIQRDIAYRVRAIESLSPTLKRIVLESATGDPLPVGAAGAHIALTLKCGDRILRNSYSLIAPSDGTGRYELIVRRTDPSRGGSHFVHDELTVGAVLAGYVPHNLFPSFSHARKHLLIGGGVGITPLLAHLAALRREGARVELHQLAAAEEVALFTQLLAPWAGDDVQVHGGREGLDLEALLSRQPLGTHVYVCGPAALMDRVEGMAVALGWPDGRIHRESFGASGGEPFTVRLARSGGEVRVGPDESMLQALENAGVAAPSLCRGGACGECLTRVLEGEPEHRDHYLTAEEKASGQFVMPCVSRAHSDMLVLDL